MKRHTKTALWVAAGAATGAGLIAWRRRHTPCPAWLAGWLESPVTAWMPPSVDRLELERGMRVLDAGSGPGRVAIPVAKAVGPLGEVVALDIQAKMLDRLKRRAAGDGVTNIQASLADISQADLAPAEFDRALLVTVLGELKDPTQALSKIARALKPDGILSITEIAGDPHYQSRTTVRQLGEAAGLKFDRLYGGWLAFTMNFVKP